MASRGGRYQRLRAIASGGMATVYLGRALGAGGFERLVAIKVMHPHIATNPEFVSMFLDEARLAARIRHPNVVSTLDVDADENGVFLVMEYVEGKSLHSVFRRTRGTGRTVPCGVALAILSDVLSGLHAAHELIAADGSPLHLVHRDVSPQNILIGVDGVTRLTDFGIARAESRLGAATRTGQVKGKLGYMSIEQLRSHTVDRRSDVYAAGIVAWELLAGRKLFQGENDGMIALAAAAGPVQSPNDVNESVPDELDEVVMRALRKAPDERFPTAAAFLEAIEAAADAVGMKIARPREVTEVLAGMDEDLTNVMARPVAPAADAQRADQDVPFQGLFSEDMNESSTLGAAPAEPGAEPGPVPLAVEAPLLAPPSPAARYAHVDDLTTTEIYQPVAPMPDAPITSPTTNTAIESVLSALPEPPRFRSNRAVAWVAAGSVLAACIAFWLAVRSPTLPDEAPATGAAVAPVPDEPRPGGDPSASAAAQQPVATASAATAARAATSLPQEKRAPPTSRPQPDQTSRPDGERPDQTPARKPPKPKGEATAPFRPERL